jgi:hypothetical protein
METYYNGAHISGNFNPVTKRKPKNWIERGYKIIVPYWFKWRDKIGSIECDCKVCEEHFMPWHGWTWIHSKECALMKYIERRPQIQNLWQYAGRDLTVITQTDFMIELSYLPLPHERN